MFKANFDFSKAIQLILYTAKYTPISDLYHILKIIYFADLIHLKNYGRTISGDEYLALDKGPVPTNLYDIIQCARDIKFFNESKEIKKSIGFIEKGYKVIPKIDPDLDFLSETEIKALNKSIKENGSLRFGDLMRKSHDDAYKSVGQDSFIPLLNIIKSFNDKDLLDYCRGTFEEETKN